MEDGRRNIGYIIGPVTNNKEEGWKKECWTWSCRRMPAAQASKHWRSHSKGLTASIHGASRHGGRKEERAGKRDERRRRARTSQASGVAVLFSHSFCHEPHCAWAACQRCARRRSTGSTAGDSLRPLRLLLVGVALVLVLVAPHRLHLVEHILEMILDQLGEIRLEEW